MKEEEDINLISLIGIVVGLALLVLFAFKGSSLVWAAPLAAMVVALTGGLDLLPAYLENYMGGFVGFTQTWFPTFMLSAIFGKILETSGAAQSLTIWIVDKLGRDKAIFISLIAGGILAYGGISGFVIIFTMYPIVLSLFKEADIPVRLIPATIMVGAFQFAMVAPGAPTIQNLIPGNHFGTPPGSAPVIGWTSSLLMFLLAFLWLQYRAKSLKANGEGYTEPVTDVGEIATEDLPNPIFSSLIPFVFILIFLNLFGQAIETSLIVGILTALIFNFSSLRKQKESLRKVFNIGAKSSISAIINTSAAVGFGTVVQAVPGFEVLTDAVLGLSANPLIGMTIAVNILAGATGSASGGLEIALSSLAGRFIEASEVTGINLEVFHRISTMSSGGLNTMPHDGAVVTYLDYSGVSHKAGYFDMFITSGLIPVLVTIIAIIMGSLGVV